MKKFLLTTLLCFTASLLMAQNTEEDNDGEKVENQYEEAEKYRRSSLALILITHKSERYAKEIEAQFQQIVPPERYNSHDISVKVISTKSKNLSAKKIAKELERQEVAKKLVSRWFNRDPYSGVCNMSLIQERGLYNASKEDNDLAQMSQRKDALLKDAGEELIQNTFVLVCDLKYRDKQKASRVGAGFLQFGALMLSAYAQNTNNASNAQMFQSLSDIANVSSQAVADIAGFSMNVQAHLFRLDWNRKISETMYSKYWVDENTPDATASLNRQAFDNDSKSFTLSYIGEYKSHAGRTVSASTSDLNMVVRDVCTNAINKSVDNLAKQYTVFKPKVPFYCGEDGRVYAYIGTKEGVTSKSKYEVIEPRLDKKGQLVYKQKAVLATKFNDIWKNSGTYITDENVNITGTAFRRTKGDRDICDKGYLMREMGKSAAQQYKRHRFYMDFFVGKANVSDSKKEEIINDNSRYYDFNRSKGMCNPMIYGVNMGWIWNFHKNIAWDVAGLNIGGGSQSHAYTYYDEGFFVASVTTGLIFRTNPWGKKKRFSLYLWPSIGGGLNRVRIIYSTEHKQYHGSGYWGETYETVYKEAESKTHLDWNIRLGMNITKRLYIGYNYGVYRNTFCIGYQF